MNFVIIKQCWTLTLIVTLLSYNGFLQLSFSHLILVANHKCRAVNRKVWLRVETLDYIGYTDSAVFKGLPGNLESSFQKVKLWFVTLKKKQSTLVQRWWIFFLPVHVSPLLEHIHMRLVLQITLLRKLFLAKIYKVFTNYIQ